MREFTDEDFEQINAWRIERGAKILPMDAYPKMGLIEDGVAAGFLTITDAHWVIAENFVSNPKAYKGDREKAILEMIETFEQYAVKCGYRFLLAVTNHPKIEEYAKLSGGKPIDYRVYGKELPWVSGTH